MDSLDGQRLEVQGGSAGTRLLGETGRTSVSSCRTAGLERGWTQALLRGAWQELVRYKRKQNSREDHKALEQGKWQPYILGGLRFGHHEALGNLIWWDLC